MRRSDNTPRSGSDTLLPLIYVVAVWMSMMACAVFAWWETSRQFEFAQGADRFGYLQMAQDIRRGSAPGGLPRFTADSEHARLVLAFLREQGLPVDDARAAGPDAYHYSAATNQIICQYPPGTGLMLAMFPEGRAVFGWQAIIIIGLAGLATWACVRAVMKGDAGAMLGAGLMCLLGQCSCLMLGVSVSYSVDLLCVPLVCGVITAFYADRPGWVGWVLAGIAGAALGWGTVVRLAAAIFVPGFLVLLMGGRGAWKAGVGRVAIFGGAFFVAGIVPLMVHQRAMTGSAVHSTYTPVDAAAPSVGTMADNLQYYFFGEGSGLVIMLGAAVVAMVLWLAGRGSVKSAGGPMGAVALWWLAATGYFLTHPVHTPYYQFPTLIICLAGMAFTVIRSSTALQLRAGWPAQLGAVLVGALVVFFAADLPPLGDAGKEAMPDTSLPAAFKDSHAWILADRLSGAMWYYHGIVAHPVDDLSADVCARFLEFQRSRHEPLYVIFDSPAMRRVLDQVTAMGGTLDKAGTFCGSSDGSERSFVTVYQVTWPEKQK